MTYLLWVLQILLALAFLFSGGIKLVLSAEAMAAMGPPNQVILPALFIKFIGVCEVLGGIGLVLPALLRIRPALTPLAAAGLTIIMIGAVAVTIAGPGIGSAVAPFVTGLLTAFVAYGRWKLAPISPR
jgi:uncharacterized membrane protein YphA (DoxX/SURF4 family)